MENEANRNASEEEVMVALLTGGPPLLPRAELRQAWLIQAERRRMEAARAQRKRSTKVPWTAGLGWVAALIMAVWLWIRPASVVVHEVAVIKPVVAVQKAPQPSNKRQEAPQQTALVQELEKLRHEIGALKATQDKPAAGSHGESRFSVFELTKGGVPRTADPKHPFSSQKLAQMLQEGIEKSLDQNSNRKNLPERVVAGPYGSWNEHGETSEGSVLVWENFPASEWQDLGLTQGEGETLLDPRLGIVWEPLEKTPTTWRGTPVGKTPQPTEQKLLTQNSPVEAPATPQREVTTPSPAPAVTSPEEPTILVTVDQQSGHGKILTKDLPALPPDKVWAVAVADEKRPTSGMEIGVLAGGMSGDLSVSFSVNSIGMSTDGVLVYPRAAGLTNASSISVSSLHPNTVFSSGFQPTNIVTTIPPNPTVP